MHLSVKLIATTFLRPRCVKLSFRMSARPYQALRISVQYPGRRLSLPGPDGCHIGRIYAPRFTKQAPNLAVLKLVSHVLPCSSFSPTTGHSIFYASSSLSRNPFSIPELGLPFARYYRISPVLSTLLMASIITRRPSTNLRMPVPVALSTGRRSYINGRGAYLVSSICGHGSHDHAGGDYNSPRFKLHPAIQPDDGTPHPDRRRHSVSSGRKRALCIGINYRNKPNELQGCIQDTEKIRRFLIQNDYKADDITVLTDETVNKPTRKNILDALSRLFEGAKSNDSLFLHYSGHGDQIPDTNGDEVDRKDEDILCYDSSIIIDDDIHEMLRSLPSGCQLTALFDSCHSGTILDLPYTYNCIGQCYGTTPGLDISADVICWSGAKDNQTGTDTPEGGVMTSAFIKAFENSPKQSYTELLHSIRTIVECKDYKQIPQLGSSRQINPNLDFIL
ncbi:caspase domain-containing protein [Armillaria borealis]|uniref:Caspase domain-containing protein n=1 Tax=Armillaria borealis TaxID=47425 RepID=A0AA39MF33_9AGAR|nr:caspase domain-containing protein [Armillaria borealis]